MIDGRREEIHQVEGLIGVCLPPAPSAGECLCGLVRLGVLADFCLNVNQKFCGHHDDIIDISNRQNDGNSFGGKNEDSQAILHDGDLQKQAFSLERLVAEVLSKRMATKRLEQLADRSTKCPAQCFGHQAFGDTCTSSSPSWGPARRL